MSIRTAYVVTSEIKEQTLQQMQEGVTPRSEYYVMLHYSNMALIDPKIFRADAGWISRHLIQCNQTSWAIANKAITSNLYNIILASGEDIGIPLALRAAHRLHKPDIFIITHGSYFGSTKFKYLAQVLRRQRNVQFLCLADSLRTRLVEEFGIAPGNVHNAGYCSDTQFFRYTDLPQNCTHIASAGAANRDYATLVAAVTDMDCQLTIAVGSAWYDQETNLGSTLPSNINARPHDYQELRALYERSAFIVVPLLPGKHACGYAVIADAMAAGRAVIATRTASPSDFVIDGETGFYVQPGDVTDLRAKIAYLLQYPDRARQMGQCARARMEDHYTVEAYCHRIETVLHGASAA